MCGIAGIIKFNSESVSEQEIRKMTGKISHRGPDDSGIFIDGPVGLGHRRLSIIDLSPRGHQPMSDEDGKVWIVFNGEIYNFQQLKVLLDPGTKFNSDSDTEIIIHLYKKYGPSCLDHLRGMFAFAIWDSGKKQLFIARDRIGKKPLKYYLDDNCFIFASELKAILENPEVRKEPDYPAIDEFLTYKYVPCPKTGFKGIYKLPPAHYMIIDADGKHEIKRYWSLDYSQKMDLSEDEWQDAIIEKLQESIRLRLVSDVPLGAHLSGGIDSSLIAALMSEAAGKIKTFSIGFKEKKFNELPYARLVAQKYDTQHQEFILEPDALELLPKLIYHYEEPYADASAIPSWYLSEMTRKHVTVALNGDGGDENFAGYQRYNAMEIYQQLRFIPFKKLLANASGLTYRLWRIGLYKKLERLLKAYTADPHDYFLNIISYFKPWEKEMIYNGELKTKAADSRWNSFHRDAYDSGKHLDWLDRLLLTGINTHLPDDLLAKVDIASMAHSLEVRSPFLDHELLELTAKMPSKLKLKGNDNKYLLKKIARRYLPPECIDRPKQGFSVPLEFWFRNGLEGYMKENLLDEIFISYGFNKAGIEKMIGLHRSGSADYSSQLYTLLCLRLWFKTWFEELKAF